MLLKRLGTLSASVPRALLRSSASSLRCVMLWIGFRFWFSLRMRNLAQRRFANKRRRLTDPVMLAEIEAAEAAAEEEYVVTMSNESEREDVMRVLDRDRRYAVDAAIVSIMKERWQIHHATLVLEVQARCLWLFKPTAKLIKKRIEDLISRDYIERNRADRAMYHYLT